MKIKKNYLLLLAGIVWLAAGFNILRIGIISYKSYVTLINLALSAAVFFLFWFMVFGKLVRRHTDRIVRYEEEMQFILKFFERKSFCIMVLMMTWDRPAHLRPLPGYLYRSLLLRAGNRAGSGGPRIYRQLYHTGGQESLVTEKAPAAAAGIKHKKAVPSPGSRVNGTAFFLSLLSIIPFTTVSQTLFQQTVEFLFRHAFFPKPSAPLLPAERALLFLFLSGV